MTTAADDLRAKTVKGTAWSYVSFVALRIPALVTLVVLTRLIAPRDFGLIALGLVIINYLDALNEFGITSEVIYSEYTEPRDLNVTFWFSMLTGVGAAVLMSALAIPFAAAFHEPRLRVIVPVLSIAFILNSIGSVHIAILRRRLDFRRLVPTDLARALSKAVFAIGFAAAGYGVWSLVYGQLAGEAACSIAVWVILKWRPAFEWDWNIVKRVARYGSHIMSVGILAVLLSDIDYFIVGRRLGAQQLGFYSVGFRLPELAVMGVCYAVSDAMFPALTRLRHDPEAMGEALSKSLRVLTLITVPIGVGIALTAQDFVATFYGGRWAPTGRVMPFIALYSVVFSITFLCGDVYKAVGRPAILTAMAGARFPLAVIALLLAVSHGIVWVAGAQFALMTTNMIVQMIVAHRIVKMHTWGFISSTRSAIIASLVMTVAVMATHHMFGAFSPLSRLLITAPVGAVVYLAVALTLERSIIREVTESFRSRLATT